MTFNPPWLWRAIATSLGRTSGAAVSCFQPTMALEGDRNLPFPDMPNLPDACFQPTMALEGDRNSMHLKARLR